jgi:hypothetical protein
VQNSLEIAITFQNMPSDRTFSLSLSLSLIPVMMMEAAANHPEEH